MAVGDLMTQYGQAEVNGLLLGMGTSYGLRQAEGFDMPPVRIGDYDRPNDRGAYVGTDRYSGRTVRYTVDIEGTSDVDIASKVQALQQALQLQGTTLLTFAFWLRGLGKRVIFARPRRFAATHDFEMDGLRAPTVLFELFAPDPSMYDQALQQPTGTLPQAAGGGATFNATFNLTFSVVTGSTGVFVVNNAGNFNARPVATIQGPITDPKIENVTTGQYLRFSGLVLTNADVLTIDFDARTILLNGSISRYSTMAADSAWWELIPGNNSIRFTAAAYQAAALLTLTFRSAWV